LYLAHGVEHTGYELLAEARQHYLAWGATAKVDQLDWAYPVLRPTTDSSTDHLDDQLAERAHRRSKVTTGMIDMLGIVSASQALSSETDIDGLQARVAETLRAMTGATGVRLLLCSDDQRDWLPPAPGDADAVPVDDRPGRALPTSVLRYIQHPWAARRATRAPATVCATLLRHISCCSVLAVPFSAEVRYKRCWCWRTA
jgi:hypothetical protein